MLVITKSLYRGLYLDEFLQTVVTYDYATIEVIEVGCCKTTAIQGHKRTQLGRSYRNDVQNHPLGAVAVL